MKIGIDARLWSQTGVGRYIRNLIYELQIIDKQNEYVLFVRDEDYNDVKFRITARNANLKFKISNCNIHWHSLDEQIFFPQILNRENLDLVHFTYVSTPVFYKRPYVLTIHDLIPFHFSTGRASINPFVYKFKRIGYKLVISRAASNAQKIIVPSNSTKKEVIEHLKISPEKIATIYEGVDKNLLDVRYKSVPLANPYFLYVGNAYPHKNVENLIRAFKKLKSSTFKLVLVGKEDYFYKRLKKEVKNPNVIFFGEATDSQLANLYRKTIAYVTPSFMEGFGLTGLEAMVNKCLVLASDIPVHREIYKDVAVYFDPHDPEDIKNLMEKIYYNTALYRSKIDLGLKRAKEFSWEKTAVETLKIYESCVGLR